MKKSVIIAAMLILCFSSYTQETIKRVYGVVKTELGEPIANAMVSVEGKDKVTMTNAEGVFTFSKLTTADSLLVIIPKLGMMKVACSEGKIEVVVSNAPKPPLESDEVFTQKRVLGNHRIHGVVQMNESGDPVPFATIVVADLEDKIVGHGATDSIGHFDMQVRGTGTYSIRISFAGYTDNYFPLHFNANDTVLSAGIISMIEGINLREVEVKDRRAEKGKRVHMNILTRSDIEYSGARDFVSLLQGKIPGLRINRMSAAPGGRVSTRIRGYGSIMLTGEPLVIMDDVIVNGEDAIQTVNNSISIDMIESVEVNKTGAGYGVRGANGVIIIKTRRGK